ncbi:MAG: NusA-like transcription termination signal-binding factor [Nanoarchaeota archaeon]|nr:NusA-like transcription termination signal-binding factor [Nanoarchaeota archaeon]MBU4299957.1 NusA-like transcription termination signal-binding factor [Nanoarchaeota archaeon]MBU4452238.1 NusA-like transcription termination signal-binding factor [Nanoarchaeota archaeon]MCG2723665.1 NusA-like transcription termination signal-binding factor [archaeon]
MKITISHEDIQTMALFEKMAKTVVVDYYKNTEDGDELIFVVKCRSLSDVVGPQGKRIKEIQSRFGRDIKVFKYSSEIKEFAENVLPVPLKSFEISEKGGKKTVKISVEQKDKSLAIGRGGKTIKNAATLLKRIFGIEDLKLL